MIKEQINLQLPMRRIFSPFHSLLFTIWGSLEVALSRFPCEFFGAVPGNGDHLPGLAREPSSGTNTRQNYIGKCLLSAFPYSFRSNMADAKWTREETNAIIDTYYTGCYFVQTAAFVSVPEYPTRAAQSLGGA